MKYYIDFDGCIGNTVKCICRLYNEDFRYYDNFKPIQEEDVNSWDFRELNCATPEYIDQYFNQPRFFECITLMKGVLSKMLEILSNTDNEIVVVSMGNTPNIKLKEEFFKDFYDYFDRRFKHKINLSFIGVDFKDYNNKSHIDMSDGIFIDDSYSNLITSNALRKICYGKVLDWNKQWQGERLLDWKDLIVGE